MFGRKKIEPEPKITGSTILNGAVIFMSVFGGVAAYKKACRSFERSVPAAMEKVEIASSIVASVKGDEDDD